MLVTHHMSKRVISVEPGQPLAAAAALLQRHRIRQLPVLSKQRLVGIVTDRDLRSAPRAAKTVGEVMTRKLVVITPTASIDEAARLLRRHRIGALPVVDGKKLVGVLGVSDVLDAFVDLSGVGEPTFRIVLAGAKGKEALRRVRQVIEHEHGELKWLHADRRDTAKLHLRLKARNIEDVAIGLEAAGFDVETVVAPAPSRV